VFMKCTQITKNKHAELMVDVTCFNAEGRVEGLQNDARVAELGLLSIHIFFTPFQ
jgi:hypothetical protein